MIHSEFGIISNPRKINSALQARKPLTKSQGTRPSVSSQPVQVDVRENPSLMPSLAQVLKCTLTKDQLSEIARVARVVHQELPNIRSMARARMSAIIKELTGQDANPDALYLNAFSSAVSSQTSFTGVIHTGEPNSSTSLTDLLLANFSADRQTLQSAALDSYEGVYTDGPGAGFYGTPNEFRILASSLRDAIWKADFQSEVLSSLNDFWADHQDHIALLAKVQFAVSAMRAIHASDLSLSGATMVMQGAGANSDQLLAAISNGIGAEAENVDDIKVTAFDINGYPSSDIVRFTRSNRHTVLYIPGETPSFHEFGSETALDRWVKEMAASREERARLTRHFSLYNLQDGFWYTGVANGLEKLGSGVWNTGINSGSRLYSKNLFFELAESMRQRSFSDADTLITSDSEITRDLWIDNFRTLNAIFWPIMMLAPELEFGALAITMGSELALEADQAIMGDTYDERKAGALGAITTGSTMLAGAALGAVARNLSEAEQISAGGSDTVSVSAVRPVLNEQPLRIGDISGFEVDPSLIEGRAPNRAGIYQSGEHYFIRISDETGVTRVYEIRSDFKLRDGYVNVVDPKGRKSVAILHNDGAGGWKRISADGGVQDRPPYEGQRASEIRAALNRRGYYVIADPDESAAFDEIEAMKERVDALRFKLEDLGREAERKGRIGDYHLVYRVDDLRPEELLAAGRYRPSQQFEAVVNLIERPATIGSASLAASNNVLDIWQYGSEGRIMYQYAIVTEGDRVGSFVDGGGYDYEFLDEVHFPPPPAENVYLLDSSDEDIRRIIAEIAASRSVNTTHGIPLQVYEDYRMGRMVLDSSPPPDLPRGSSASSEAGHSLKSLDTSRHGQRRTQDWVEAIPSVDRAAEEPLPGPSRAMQREVRGNSGGGGANVGSADTAASRSVPPGFVESAHQRTQDWVDAITPETAQNPDLPEIDEPGPVEEQRRASENRIRTRYDETSVTGTSQSKQQRTHEWVKEYQANNR
ncbi:dermonecrotic toxin domain-containing protein [Nitratireductor sp. L15S-10]|uniref:dermonecrotic toxin domain-containing protein n=1 Tax=Nitratireductor sp. L15S-10 TaxID=3034028 RepID=UPI00385794C4